MAFAWVLLGAALSSGLAYSLIHVYRIGLREGMAMKNGEAPGSPGVSILPPQEEFHPLDEENQ